MSFDARWTPRSYAIVAVDHPTDGEVVLQPGPRVTYTPESTVYARRAKIYDGRLIRWANLLYDTGWIVGDQNAVDIPIGAILDQSQTYYVSVEIQLYDGRVGLSDAKEFTAAWSTLAVQTVSLAHIDARNAPTALPRIRLSWPEWVEADFVFGLEDGKGTRGFFVDGRVDEDEGTAIFRVRMDFDSNDPPGSANGYTYLWEWSDGAGDVLVVAYEEATSRFIFFRAALGSGNGAYSGAATFSSGDYLTIIIAWTATTISIAEISDGVYSTGGNTDVPVAGDNAYYNTREIGTLTLGITPIWSMFWLVDLTFDEAAVIAAYDNDGPEQMADVPSPSPTLYWRHKFERIEVSTGTRFENVEPLYYLIARRESDDPWVVLDRVPGSQLVYMDYEVVADRPYRYAVLPIIQVGTQTFISDIPDTLYESFLEYDSLWLHKRQSPTVNVRFDSWQTQQTVNQPREYQHVWGRKAPVAVIQENLTRQWTLSGAPAAYDDKSWSRLIDALERQYTDGAVYVARFGRQQTLAYVVLESPSRSEQRAQAIPSVRLVEVTVL